MDTNGPRENSSHTDPSDPDGCVSDIACGVQAPPIPIVRYDFDFLILNDPVVRVRAGGYYEGPALGKGEPVLVWTGSGVALEWGGVIIEDEEAISRVYDAIARKSGESGPIDLKITGLGGYYEHGSYQLDYAVRTSFFSPLTGSMTHVATLSEESEVGVPGGAAKVGIHTTMEFEHPRIPFAPIAVPVGVLLWEVVKNASCADPYTEPVCQPG